MGVRRELIPLGLALALVGSVGAMAVQARSARLERATARGQVLVAAETAIDSDMRPVRPADLSALPLRVAALPVPTRDIEAIRRALKSHGRGTYIGDMLAEGDSSLFRWPDRTVTALRVWVQPVAGVPGWDDRYPRMVRDVFPEWSAAGFPLRFLHVVDSASADLHVYFTTTLPGRRIGETSWFRDQNGWIVAAGITIATRSPDGGLLSPELISGIARHEVGHALGLGHATDPATVMYPESRRTTIAPADRATLHLLYTLPPGSLRSPDSPHALQR